MATDAKRFLKPEEAGKLLGVSKQTIYRMIHAKQLPAVKLMGRYSVPMAAISDLEAKAIASTNQPTLY